MLKSILYYMYMKNETKHNEMKYKKKINQVILFHNKSDVQIKIMGQFLVNSESECFYFLDGAFGPLIFLSKLSFLGDSLKK